VRGLFEKAARVQTLWRRRQALLGKERYAAVPELVEVMKLLEAGKFEKAVAFVYSKAAEQVRTNNHVERANRRFRFTEKLRYKWRRRKWVVRFVLLALDRWWRQADRALAPSDQAARGQQESKRPPHRPPEGGGDEHGVSWQVRYLESRCSEKAADIVDWLVHDWAFERPWRAPVLPTRKRRKNGCRGSPRA
jgi:hypothetical protein